MIKKFELRGVFNYHLDLNEYVPPDKLDVGMWIDFKVGCVGEEGTNDFRVFICTPKFLERMVSIKRYLWTRHFLMINEFNLADLTVALQDMLNARSGENTNEGMEKISRYAEWEYEDYNKGEDLINLP